MKYIDLRSDTVTLPTLKMRDAIAQARVGDDVYGEDETVAELEQLAASRIGKEAAIFVPSGTMGNQVAVMTHTKHGDEIIIDESYHIFQHEVGAAAVLSGVQVRTIKGFKGIMDPLEVRKTIREENIHFPQTGLICMENANSLGVVIPLNNMQKIYEMAQAYGLPVHLDGARVFNAAIALNTDVRKITQYCDSVMFCLSKGLCAPVGSILAGTKNFIDKARKKRKMLGGGMRQAGFLAAAGIVALDEMILRLADDHQNARMLAEGLLNIDGIELEVDDVQINMVFFKIKTQIECESIVEKLLERNIKINPPENGVFRFVTNNDVNKDDIYYVIKTLKECIK